MQQVAQPFNASGMGGGAVWNLGSGNHKSTTAIISDTPINRKDDDELPEIPVTSPTK